MIEVCCALIVNEDGKVLVAQRSERMSLPLKMEFPGGKIEAGESPEACLIREIKEELNVEIAVLSGLDRHSHVYPDFTIQLIPFICKIVSGTIELKEHAAYQWLMPQGLPFCDWAEADIPVVNDYLDTLKNNI